MRGFRRYMIEFPSGDIREKIIETASGVQLYKAGHLGSENMNLVQHVVIHSVPKTEKYLKKGDVVYVTHEFQAPGRLNVFSVDGKPYAAQKTRAWTGDADLPERERQYRPIGLFVIRGSKIKALNNVNILSMVGKIDGALDFRERFHFQRGQVINSQKYPKGTVLLFEQDSDYPIKMPHMDVMAVPERWVYGQVDPEGTVTLKEGYNIIKLTNKGDGEFNSVHLPDEVRDKKIAGIGKCTQGFYKGANVAFKSRGTHDGDKRFAVCRDTDIIAIW